MSAPDRIWADLNMGIWLGAPQPNRRPSPPTEYVRADLIAPSPQASLRAAAEKLLSYRIGDLPDRGYLADNDRSRAAIHELAVALSQPSPEPSEEEVELAAKAFAEASGYYTPFHRGLSSPSADKLRAGIRAALSALNGPHP